jgi:hypothetical protein
LRVQGSGLKAESDELVAEEEQFETHTAVTERLWPWLEPFCILALALAIFEPFEDYSNCCLFVRKRCGDFNNFFAEM